MVEDDFAAQMEHLRRAHLHGGLRKESNNHPSYTVPKRSCEVVATPEPKSLAARIASSRPVISRAVPCRYWIMQVLCHVLCIRSGFGLEQTALRRLTFTCFHLLLWRDQLDLGIVIGVVRILLS